MKLLTGFILGFICYGFWQWSLYFNEIYVKTTGGLAMSSTWFITIPYTIFCIAFIGTEIYNNWKN